MFFYRVHWRDCPEFSPENAESIAWGMRDHEVMCPRCCGNLFVKQGKYEIECPECEGTGTVYAEPQPGYSCCESPKKLYKYFNSGSRFEPDDNEKVIEFSGKIVGCGADDEPLVIPDMKHVREMTWAEFKKLLNRK